MIWRTSHRPAQLILVFFVVLVMVMTAIVPTPAEGITVIIIIVTLLYPNLLADLSRPGHDGLTGYDTGKKVKGRKIHALVDTQGLPLRIVIHSAGGPHNPLAKLGLLHQYPTPSSTRADRKFLVLPEYSSELNRAALEWLREAKDRARRILGGSRSRSPRTRFPRRWPPR